MNTIRIGRESYVRRECKRCSATGRVFDSTEQDKVNVGPFAGRCSTCSGLGYTLHSLAVIEGAARADARIPKTIEPIGEMPDWMC